MRFLGYLVQSVAIIPSTSEFSAFMPFDELLIHNLGTQGYHLIESFLPSNHYEALVGLAQDLYQQGIYNKAKIGHKSQTHNNSTIRTDEILWLDEYANHSGIQTYLNAIQTLIQTLNRRLFLGLTEFETHFAAYKPGSFYQKHCDQFATTKDRKISCVYYLNPHWFPEWGGELKLYDNEQELIQTIFPHGNRLLCFTSDLPHEVCTTHHPRYSLTGWLKSRAMNLID